MEVLKKASIFPDAVATPLHQEPAPILLKPMPGTFTIQTQQITDPAEKFLKVKGAFKFRVENLGTVGFTAFGSMYFPSYSDVTYDIGSNDLMYAEDANIAYDDIIPGINQVRIRLTLYIRHQ